MEKKESIHHVVIFPLPLQGPINSTFKLAELLLLSGLHVTFVLTEYIYHQLVKTTNIENTMTERYSGFQLKCMPDGLSFDQSSAGGNRFMEIFDTLKLTVEPIFRDMLTSGSLVLEKMGGVSCIIADGAWGFPCDVGKEIGVPVFAVRTISPCCLWAFFCLPELIEAGELPFQVPVLQVGIRALSTVGLMETPPFSASGQEIGQSTTTSTLVSAGATSTSAAPVAAAATHIPMAASSFVTSPMMPMPYSFGFTGGLSASSMPEFMQNPFSAGGLGNPTFQTSPITQIRTGSGFPMTLPTQTLGVSRKAAGSS